MSQYMDAADAIKRIASMLEGFKVAADALERIGSFDNAAKEATAARDAAVAARDDAQEELDALLTKLEQSKLDHEIMLVDANDQARAFVDDAKVAAKKLTDEAISAANEKVAAVLADGQSQLTGLQAALLAAHAAHKEAASKLESIDAQVAEKQAQLDSITQSIDTLKAKLV